jgi:hypothetical protein
LEGVGNQAGIGDTIIWDSDSWNNGEFQMMDGVLEGLVGLGYWLVLILVVCIWTVVKGCLVISPILIIGWIIQYLKEKQ